MLEQEKKKWVDGTGRYEPSVFVYGGKGRGGTRFHLPKGEGGSYQHFLSPTHPRKGFAISAIWRDYLVFVSFVFAGL